jgi:hypothetical protein
LQLSVAAATQLSEVLARQPRRPELGAEHRPGCVW